MRDGVQLHTEVYLPDEQPRPVVLTRGYRPGNDRDAARFNQAGYVYVGQSTRGHGLSEGARGVAERFLTDGQDGYDALTWISRQPWANGQIAMYGRSYWGATQWLAAPLRHPNLKAIIPQATNADFWQCGYWCNGALTLAMTARGRAYGPNDWDAIDRLGWKNFFRRLPLITLPDLVEGPRDAGATQLWKDYIQHSTFDEYWSRISIRGDGKDDKYERIRIPVYLMGGWYDYYAGAAFHSYQKLRAVGATEEIRVTVGAGNHLNKVVGARELGDDAVADEAALAIRWLDYVLKGVRNGIETEPPIRIFVMGVNEWRNERQWPPEGTVLTKYYFHSDGGRAGVLDTNPPGDERPIRYVYDPDDPVPTIGGNHSFTDGNIPDLIRDGPYDQTPNERRGDVLVFTTAPLERDVEITGPVTVKLYAASDAQDTDFVARLIDVHPDGTAFNLTEGILRARFRESLWEAPKLLTPGTVYPFTIELQPTSNVFKRGHRVRVHVTSSSWPLWDRNPNTGHAQGLDAELRPAVQTVYQDRRYPSHILLPVVRRDDES